MQRMLLLSMALLISSVSFAADQALGRAAFSGSSGQLTREDIAQHFLADDAVLTELAAHPNGYARLGEFVERTQAADDQIVKNSNAFYDFVFQASGCSAQEIARTTDGMALLEGWGSSLQEIRAANESCFPDAEFPAIAQWRNRTPIEKEVRTLGLSLEKNTANLHTSGWRERSALLQAREGQKAMTKMTRALLQRNPAAILPLHARVKIAETDALLIPTATSENAHLIDFDAVEKIFDSSIAYCECINSHVQQGEFTFAEQRALKELIAFYEQRKASLGTTKTMVGLSASHRQIEEARQRLAARHAEREADRKKKKACVIL